MEEVPPTVDIDEPPAPPFVRSWSDVVQFAVTAAMLVLTLALTRSSGGGIRAVEREVLRGVEGLTEVVAGFLVVIVFWDTHRVGAALAVLLAFAATALGCGLALRREVKSRPGFLSATRDALARDVSRLRDGS